MTTKTPRFPQPVVEWQETGQGISKKGLVTQTITAFVTAMIVLFVVVLPIEFQRDPTGLGAVLGLTGLTGKAGTPDPAGVQPALIQPSAPVSPAAFVTSENGEHWQTTSKPQSNQLTLTLLPGKGLEVKAMMQQGQRFIYHWQAEGGVLDFDMHGEEPLAVEDFTSFWEAKGFASAQGGFTAPFDGSHGWYWFNPGQETVMLTLQIDGFYQGVYLP